MGAGGRRIINYFNSKIKNILLIFENGFNLAIHFVLGWIWPLHLIIIGDKFPDPAQAVIGNRRKIEF